VNELNKKLEDESKKKNISISETQELIQQLTVCMRFSKNDFLFLSVPYFSKVDLSTNVRRENDQNGGSL
jgi:hypothetical protein